MYIFTSHSAWASESPRAYRTSGAKARIIATLDEYERRQDAERRRRWAEELAAERARFRRDMRVLEAEYRAALAGRVEALRREVEADEAPVIKACAAVEHLFRAAMGVAGYHLVSRSRWRRRLKGASMTSEVQCGRSMEVLGRALAATPLKTDEELARFLAEARSGEPRALDAARYLLAKGNPETCRVFGGDAGARILERLALRLGGDDQAACLAALRRAELMRDDLLGDSVGTPTALERLLVQRVVIALLDAEACDLRALNASPLAPAKVAAILDKARGRAHARFAQAVKALSTARRLAVPAINVLLGRTGGGGDGREVECGPAPLALADDSRRG